MGWDEMLKADARAIALDAFGPCEPILYYPLGVAGNARSIKAAFVRNDFGPINESTNTNAMRIMIVVPNDADIGVTEWALNRDQVFCRPRIGGALVRATVRRIVQQSAGFWWVEATG